MSDTAPVGCSKNIDGDKLAALKGITSDEMKTYIKAHDGPPHCKTEITDSLIQTLTESDSFDVWLKNDVAGSLGWSGANASNSLNMGTSSNVTNTTGKNHQNRGISAGCRQTLMNIIETSSLYSQSTCNFKQNTNKTNVNLKMNATISIIVGPTESMITGHERDLAEINRNIRELIARPTERTSDVASLEILSKQLSAARAAFDFSITNSRFKITQSNMQELSNTMNQDIQNTTEVREAILKKAKADAITNITNKYEMGALASADLESYASTKANETSLSTTEEIINGVNASDIEVDMNGGITLRVNGSLKNLDIDLTQGNITKLKTELLMQAASKLGKSISDEIVQDVISSGKTESDGKGLASYEKAIADGIAKLAEALKPPPRKGLFDDLFGGMIGKIAMIAIPIIIIIILFSMFGFKIALVGALIFGIYLAIAYFIGLTPFSKEKNEQPIKHSVWDLSTRDEFINFVRNTVVPRRHIFLKKLQIILNKEINDAAINEYTSVSYMDQLNSAAAYIEDVKDAVLISEWEPRIRGAGVTRPPPWFLSAFGHLELSIWERLDGSFKKLLVLPGTPQVNVIIHPGTTEAVNKERVAIIEAFQTFPLDGSELAQKVYDYVITESFENPEPWENLMKEFNLVNNIAIATAATGSFGDPVASAVTQVCPSCNCVDANTFKGAMLTNPPSYTMAIQEQPVQQNYTRERKKTGVYNSGEMGGEIMSSMQREYSRRTQP